MVQVIKDVVETVPVAKDVNNKDSKIDEKKSSSIKPRVRLTREDEEMFNEMKYERKMVEEYDD